MQRPPSGGLGNQLFQVYFGQAVARLNSLPLSLPTGLRPPKVVRTSPFAEFRRRPFEKKLNISNEDLLRFGLTNVLAMISTQISNGKSVCLSPGILGVPFFELARLVSPSDVFQLNSEAKEGTPTRGCGDTSILKVALHFRGGDFLQWDSRAILPPTFYSAAIDFVRSSFDCEIQWHLVTDDSGLSSFKHCQQLLHLDHIPERSWLEDFYLLADCDVVISSPSTFCFWASVLGKNKIIQSKEWINYKLSAGDHFWSQVAQCNSESDIYRLIHII
jgi:hypothetical protein